MGSQHKPCGDEPLCSIVTPTGMLGYGVMESEIELGLQLARERDAPTGIVVDSGSTDSGPVKLALGSMTTPRTSYLRDLRHLIRAVHQHRIPLLVSSAGGDGSNAHVKELLGVIEDIMQEPENVETKLKVLAIYSDINRNVVLQRLENGRISGCGSAVPALTVEAVEATPTIVGHIGPEPFLTAMSAHPDYDVLIAGRAYDPAPHVAFCAFRALGGSGDSMLSLHSHLLGGFTHMGKVLECGGVCATPKSKSAIGTVYVDGSFEVRPLTSGAVCSPTTVAAHTLYEKSRPDRLYGPGGYLDLTSSSFEQLADGASVRVRGSVFQSSHDDGQSYTVKLEGARTKGQRIIFMGSFSDPILISRLSFVLEQAKDYAAQYHKHIDEKWELGFHVYGGGEKMNALDDAMQAQGAREVFIVGEALAETQQVATSIASAARIARVHGQYEGQKTTGGNFGMGIGGVQDIETGPCAEFSLYHLMELDDGQEYATEIGAMNDAELSKGNLFKWEMAWIRPGQQLVRRPICRSDGVVETVKAQSAQLNVRLVDIAKIIRSKNPGPFEITFDIIFDDKSIYQGVKTSGVLTPRLIAQLYHVPVEDIIWCGYYDQALAFKATIPRLKKGVAIPSGGFMENDVHGSQQHKPLLDIRIVL